VNGTVFLHLNERLNENKVNEYYTIVNFNKVIQLSTLKGAAENYNASKPQYGYKDFLVMISNIFKSFINLYYFIQ
jgi:hypothetical protein